MRFRSIPVGGFFDRHPILVPATTFFVFWIPYLIIFFRRSIAFGDLGEPYPVNTAMYWVLFVIQLGVCVISHSLTIRTIVRMYAPCWLIWGSVAFYSLSPAWGIMTAADIRHPLFAAVFCVFTSSMVFALFSKSSPRWLWIQLGGGALCVCLLRAEGIWVIAPALVLLALHKLWKWRSLEAVRGAESVSSVSSVDGSGGSASSVAAGPLRSPVHFAELAYMEGTPAKKEESLWGDVCAAFLVLSGVCLLFLFAFCAGWGLPLGEPSYGHGSGVASVDEPLMIPFGMNLTGSPDVAGIIPFADIASNSWFAALARRVAEGIFAFQCFPVENLTFSWVVYLILFCGFFLWALWVAFGSLGGKRRGYDLRPLIVGLPMFIMIGFMAFVPADATLRYMMPILAAQPMFFSCIFRSLGSQRNNG